jgi:antitoxin (DNA-binding transcriptional repressor) of toxin-antitoxin stability system
MPTFRAKCESCATLKEQYTYYMKTLSPTQARANLTHWLDRAIAGQAIAVTHKGRVIKLQPVTVTEDWAAEEYGMTSEELDEAAERLLKKGEALLASGQAVPWSEFKKRRKKR